MAEGPRLSGQEASGHDAVNMPYIAPCSVIYLSVIALADFRDDLEGFGNVALRVDLSHVGP